MEGYIRSLPAKSALWWTIVLESAQPERTCSRPARNHVLGLLLSLWLTHNHLRRFFTNTVNATNKREWPTFRVPVRLQSTWPTLRKQELVGESGSQDIIR